ncbi:MAG: NAD(P)-binding protein [Proteobacteria bacterium]|nr:NAD(P)-binding protein [Pseudomonadota bacterium]
MPSTVHSNAVRVVVLGGGIAGLAAAFELSDPRHDGRFDVQLYQIGWRLGGKCASGRDMDYYKRTKEHGPHILFGFYDNAFAILRQAYDILAEDKTRPFKKFTDALVPHHQLVAMEQQSDASWLPWVVNMPTTPGQAGDPLSLADEVAAFLEFILEVLHSGLTRLVTASPLDGVGESASTILQVVQTQLLAAGRLLRKLPQVPPAHRKTASARAAAALADLRQTLRVTWTAHAQSVDARRAFIIVDLGIATAFGALVDGLIWPTKQSVAAANKDDYRDWLRKHHALDMTANSAVVRALYDTVFAYPHGDVTQPGEVEAGSAVITQRGLVTYRGPAAWKMRTGTGDVTAAPLYEVLRKRGVKVHFFHRVDKLIASDHNTIDQIRIGVQATVINGEYDPLITVKGISAWPDRPDYAQLHQGDALRDGHIDLESRWTPWKDPVGPLILSRGDHYDKVVLAMPVDAVADVAPEPLLPAWQKMLDGASTVATQSVQVWLTRQTGWPVPGAVAPVVTGYDRTRVASGSQPIPIDTWLDASEVLPYEDWPAGAVPVGMAILCGPMRLPFGSPPPSNHGFPGTMQSLAAAAGQNFLGVTQPLWPALNGPSGFDWSALWSPSGQPGPIAFNAQFWVAAVNPSDRYTLTRKGNSKTRLAPGASGYSNMVICGDWTDYGYNLGCFEGAVISGLQAANAITGNPRPIIRDPFRGS